MNHMFQIKEKICNLLVSKPLYMLDNTKLGDMVDIKLYPQQQKFRARILLRLDNLSDETINGENTFHCTSTMKC